MANEYTLLTKKDLEENPRIIGESLAQLAQAIEETKEDLQAIQERGLWKRLTTNSTRDLAAAMLKQNDSISAFLTIVQGIMFLCMNNVLVLGGILESLEKVGATDDMRGNQYIQLAKDYLSEAIISAQKATKNEKEIAVLRTQLTEINSQLEPLYSEVRNYNMQIENLQREVKKSQQKAATASTVSKTALLLVAVLLGYIWHAGYFK